MLYICRYKLLIHKATPMSLRTYRPISGLLITILCTLCLSSCTLEDLLTGLRKSRNSALPIAYPCAIEVVPLGQDDAIAVSISTRFRDFSIDTKQRSGASLMPGDALSLRGYSWGQLIGTLPEKGFPNSLDGLFVIENLSDSPQRCFVYLWGSNPAHWLGVDRRIPTMQSTLEQVREDLERLLSRDSHEGLHAYWQELHAHTPSIALELAPRQRIALPWR